MAFGQSDLLFVTDIYPAGEAAIPGITGETLVAAIRASGHPAVRWVERKEQLTEQVRAEVQPGDLVITLGAGDIWKAGPGLLERL